VLAYSNTFESPFVFDDVVQIQNNPLIMDHSINGFRQAFKLSRPLGIISFQLNYLLWGDNVFWFHFVNILIHILTALLVYKFLQLLTRTPLVSASAVNDDSLQAVPFLVALLFVAHPVQTQAVTYIVQRFASLATLFYLAAAILYLQARLTQVKADRLQQPAALLLFGLAVLCAVMALFSKETAFTLPAAIVLIELVFFRWRNKKAYCIATLAGGGVAALFFWFVAAGRSLAGAISALDAATRLQTLASRSDYLFTQFRVIMTYIRLIFLPIKQSIDYDYHLSHSFFEWQVICSFSVLIALLAVAVWLLKISGDHSPLLRLAAFGMLWFFLTLAVESSFIPIIDLIFEHRLYLPSFGALTAIVSLILYFRPLNSEPAGRATAIGFLVLVCILALSTWKRNAVWRSEVALWTDATTKYPNTARGWNNLGGAYIKQREPLAALKALVRSIELDPSKADAWNNLGMAIDQFGTYNDRFHRTSEMFRSPGSTKGNVVNAWLGDVNNNLGLAYEVLGNFAKAAECYSNAVGFNPALGLAYYNLGIVSARNGDMRKLAEQQQILLMIDPVLAERLRLRVGTRY
jgi:tetratricopeptide (TPR) repeat protein